jgi:peptide/nickel transport system substrate-binding protein
MNRHLIVVIVVALAVPLLGLAEAGAAAEPQRGGTLNFAVGVEPPSFDGHREGTFGLAHPIAPHYSTLVKFDPDAYPKVIGDLAESWTTSGDGKTYTFKIRKGVKFHDGSPLTARDVKASYDRIVFPPSDVVSARKAHYAGVEKIEAPDATTVVFRLRWPVASFLSHVASPWNFIYKADILAKDQHWYEKNVMGSGPFKFVEYVAGSHWVGKRNEDYHVKGRPYLDGYRAVFIKDTAARVGAIRSGRVAIEFRGFAPSERDAAVRAMGKDIEVKESSLTTGSKITFNTERKPFNDPRVRRALSLGIDRWQGAQALSKISTAKWVGGLMRPGAEFALTEEELAHVAGYGKDIEASRREARRLLKEAGVPEGFSFEITNRPPPMPYETVAIWLIDQWRRIGLNVTQTSQDLGVYYNNVRSGNFSVAMTTISDYADDPDFQLAWFLSPERSPDNYGRYRDPVLDDLYVRQSQTLDKAQRRQLVKQFQVRVLDEMAWELQTLWWHRIMLHSPRLKGVKVLPSHFLNQDLSSLWLEKE